MKTTVCVAGGGPAGIMLGYLLARSGINVAVLEKHADFFRDFRGDTVHPSTLNAMDELGLLDDFLKIPHSEVRELSARIGSKSYRVVQFDRVPGRCKFVALMPQWDLLNFLAERALAFPSFRLLMETEATDLVREDGCVRGVYVRSARGEETIEADLVVGCDGRHSTLRQRAGLKALETGAPIDALWMRISKDPAGRSETFGIAVPGGILVALDRGDYYQCALVIRKGGLQELQARGIEAFRANLAALAPFLRDRTNEINDWSDVKLLTVTIDRLREWYVPGLLCIGDAAHAMSPVGGVGINLAIQDAIATANLLTDPLRRKAVTLENLRGVQRRREFPAKATQWLQVRIQNLVLNRVLDARQPFDAPMPVRQLDRSAFLRRIPARIIGVGVRPEHVKTRPQ